MMIPRTPVGICMRIALSEVWESALVMPEERKTHEAEAFGNDTTESTNTAGRSGAAAIKSVTIKDVEEVVTHKYMAAHM